MSVDLKTCYLGMQLKNPLVASASPLTGDLDTLRRLEDAGQLSTHSADESEQYIS